MSSTGLTLVNFALMNDPAVVVGPNTYVFDLSGEEEINAGPKYTASPGR